MKRHGASKAASESHLKAPVSQVGGRNSDEVWSKKNTKKSGHWLLSFAAHRGEVTWSEITYAFFAEYVAAIIITLGVGIGSWFQGANLAVNALTIAVFYSGAYYWATRLPSSDRLPRHGHGGLTFGYLFTADIGLWGWLLYTMAQYLGCMTAGGAFLGPLYSGLQGGAVLGAAPTTVVHSLIPVPVVTGSASSLTTVILLELFGAAAFVFVVIVKHHLNTQVQKDDDSDTEGQNAKNMRKATKLGAFTIFILVLIGYQFQVWTYNNVAWLGPAFGGVNGVLPTDFTRQINNQVNLYSSIYTDSVFDTTGWAAALYLLMPMAGGLLGVGVAWLFMFMGFDRRNENDASDYYVKGPDQPWMHANLQSAVQAANMPMNTSTSVGMRSTLLDPTTGRPA